MLFNKAKKKNKFFALLVIFILPILFYGLLGDRQISVVQQKSISVKARKVIPEETGLSIEFPTSSQLIAEKNLQSSLPTEKNKNEINLISIRGERHSGTNWLRQLILKNCPKLTYQIYSEPELVSLNVPDPKNPGKTISKITEDKMFLYDADGKYGWKHGLLHDDFDQLLDKSDILVIIFRDWRTWIPKMRKQNYQQSRIPRNHLQWPMFLKARFPADAQKWVKSYNQNFNPAEDQYIGRAYYENIIDLRTRKYRNWLSLIDKQNNSSLTENRIISVRYEDLLDQETARKFFAENLREKFDLYDSCNANYVEHLGYSKFGESDYKKKGSPVGGPKNKIEQEKIPEQFLNQIKNMLDVELETRLGYL